MLPRLNHQIELRERERQLEAERIAAGRAGEALNALAESRDSRNSQMNQQSTVQEQKNATTSNSIEKDTTSSPKIGNKALKAVLTALSNYNDEDNEENLENTHGWGVESEIEGSRSWDRPIVLHGADGILTKHHNHNRADDEDNEQYHSPYRVMEDMDAIDRICIQEGSGGIPAYNWLGAFHDSKQELFVHLKECWRDIVDCEESGGLEKFLLVCEFPVTVCRKFTIAIPCEGSYCRPLVALALVFSPLWFGLYLYVQHDKNIWDIRMAIFIAIMAFVGMMVIRYAPGGDGSMAAHFSIPIALYGFIVAATWIGKFILHKCRLSIA